jgi:hypothetical protein
MEDQEEDEEDYMESGQNENDHSKVTKKSRQKVLASQVRDDMEEVGSYLKVLAVTSDLREGPREEWKVSGVTVRCNICNMLHQPGTNQSKTDCLFYSSVEKKMRGKNMLQHPGVIYKGNYRWGITYPFRDELTKYGFPKMGITDPDEINNMLKDLTMGARRLSEKSGSSVKANHAGLDWEEKDTQVPLKSSLKKKINNKKDPDSVDSSPIQSEDDRE